ncbi:MAG: hypothetical protein WCF46_05100, partial [Nitrososphaeraceae archaeon]
STTIINFWLIERIAYAYPAYLKILKDIQFLFMNKNSMSAKEQPHFLHLFSIYLLASVAESFNVTVFMPRRA